MSEFRHTRHPFVSRRPLCLPPDIAPIQIISEVVDPPRVVAIVPCLEPHEEEATDNVRLFLAAPFMHAAIRRAIADLVMTAQFAADSGHRVTASAIRLACAALGRSLAEITDLR